MAQNTDSFIIDLEHYQQKYNWDCGLACIMMVLPSVTRQKFVESFLKICEEEGFDQSTWSIDLAYLLHRFGVKLRYLTITMGVDPGLSSEVNYKSIMSKDTDRVNDRFMMAKAKGVVVEQGSTTIDDMVRHLSKNGPIIILVNANLLVCDNCLQSNLYLGSCILCPPRYQGHYIVLIGYNHKSSRIIYRNPTFKDMICSISFDALEDARRSYGTDEDIIFIYTQAA